MYRTGCIQCFVLTMCVLSGFGQDPQIELSDLKQELELLRLELQTIKSTYQERLQELEEKLDRLTGAGISATFNVPEPPAVQPSNTSSASGSLQTSSGGERTLQALNPEISVTGDVSARYSDNRGNDEFNRMSFDGFEMAIQHPLDPFSLAKFFVTFEEGEFSLEEGYMTWESLPGRLGLKVGRFHNNFGKLNRHHKHALPWVNRDLPTAQLFGDEGLIGTGVSVSWLPPQLPISQTSEASFEIVNNSNDVAFSGKGFGDLIYVGRLQNYYDLTDSAYFEWGISGATAHWDTQEQNRSTVLGLDLSYRWQPLRRAQYESFEVRSEFFYNDRDNWSGGNVFGMYASGEYQLKRRWYTGLRYQFQESLEDNDQNSWGISPFLTFWQSEWVRLRAQYDFLNTSLDSNENRFLLQFTWALGPHKHEAY